MEHRIEETIIDENYWQKTDNVCQKTLSTDNDSSMFMEIIPIDKYYVPSNAPPPSKVQFSNAPLPSKVAMANAPPPMNAPLPSKLPMANAPPPMNAPLPSKDAMANAPPPMNAPLPSKGAMANAPPSIELRNIFKGVSEQSTLTLIDPSSIAPSDDSVQIYEEGEYIKRCVGNFNEDQVGTIDKFRTTFKDVSDDFRNEIDNAVMLSCDKLQESIDKDTVEYENEMTACLSLMISNIDNEVKLYADKAKKLYEDLIQESIYSNDVRIEQEAISKLKEELAKREENILRINNKRKMN